MLNLLKSEPGHVYCVSFRIKVGDKNNYHCVMFSTIKESHAPFGKIVDNNTKVNPAYIEEKDSLSKKAAVKAWKDFFGQNPATHGYELAIDPLQVFELVHIP